MSDFHGKKPLIDPAWFFPAIFVLVIAAIGFVFIATGRMNTNAPDKPALFQK